MGPLIRPSKWYYAIGFGFLLVGGLAWSRFHEVRMAAVRDGLTSIIVPGEGTVTFPDRGHGTIFLEHGSIVGSRIFVTPPEIGALRCALTAARSGERVGLAPAWLPLSYAGDRRAGVAIYDFWVAAPGTYRLSAGYPGQGSGSSMVLAVGYGYLGDLSGTVVGGLGASVGLILTGLASWVVVWVLRQRYRRRIYGRFH